MEVRYKMTVTLCNGEKLIYPDLTAEQTKSAGNIWREGARYKREPGKWEIVNPFTILSVFLDEQEPLNDEPEKQIDTPLNQTT